MEAKDLRIGNYIFSLETQEPQKIVGISLENPFIDSITFDYTTYEEIEPIILTEHWLLKFGFRKNTSSEELIYFLPIPNLKCELQAALYMGEFVIEIHNHLMPIIPEVEFVHQLQNLYFALTQTELTLS